MTTLFPAALDNYPDPAAGDSLTGHAQKHTDLNDAVEAIEAFIGIENTPDPGTINARLIAIEDPRTGIQFDMVTPDAPAEGQLSWNVSDGTLDLGLAGGLVTLQIGQEQVFLGLNKTGVDIAEGVVVYITGAQGNRATIDLAKADANLTSNATIGITTQAIANNQQGYVTVQGLVRNIDTSAIPEGDQLFLSATVAGAYTNLRPEAPGHGVLVGFCIRSHTTVGSVYVHVTNGFDLGELHDVKLTSLANGEFLAYDSAIPAWVNVPAPTGGGGSATVKQVSLDFGSVPVYSKAISFADANISATSKVTMTAHAEGDELEMDGFSCAVQCGSGVATAYIHAIPGPVTGIRKFNYLIG